MASRRAAPTQRRSAQHVDPGIGFAIWRYALREMPHDHAHADIEINLLTRGTMRYLIGGQWLNCDVGDLLIFWAGDAHHMTEYTAGSAGIWMTMPVSWFLGNAAGQPLMERLLRGPLIERAIRDSERFAAWAKLYERTDPVSRRIARLEAEARLLRVITSAPANQRTQRQNDDGDPLVAEMAATMRNHLDEELTAADIASGTGLHPRYAMSRFKQVLGVTVWQYLLRLRVAEAQRRLLTGDDDLLQIAYASGFGSAARFHATFKKLTGSTPAAYRRQRGG